MTTADAPEDNEHQNRRDLLGRHQYGIDDAILTRPVSYLGISQLRLDDSALG
jgi:hypothetical protein